MTYTRDWDKIYNDYKTGLTLLMLSDKYKCGIIAIKNHFKKRNFVMRNIKERRNLTEQQEEKKKNIDYNILKQEYDSGFTLKQLAIKYNSGIDKIRSIFKRNGFKIQERGEFSKLKQYFREQKNNIDWKKIGDEYTKGLSLNILSKKYNYSESTIAKNLRKHNIKIKTRSEAQNEMVKMNRHFSPNKGKYMNEHSSWKGGFNIYESNNYKRQYIYNGQKYISYSHHIYMKENNLKIFPKGFCIHHKDGNTLNDNIENLEFMTRGQHTSLHNSMRGKK